MARLNINRAAWDRLGLQTAAGAAHKAASVTRRRVGEEVVKAGRVDTGALAGSWEATPIKPNWYRVWSPVPYARYQNDGVGPFGPKTKPLLVFMPKGGTHLVATTHVAGFKGAHFMEAALGRLRLRDFL